MHRLKTGKGALKDYHMWIADELDDYAEIPDDCDPISHIIKFDTADNQVIPQKKKYTNYFQKVTSNYPKYSPDFNFQAVSQQIFEVKTGNMIARYLTRSDIARLVSTCWYFNKIFLKNHIWLSSLVKSYGYSKMSDEAVKSINIGQYYRYFRYNQCDGIMFDTDSLRKDMKAEDKSLVGHIVDFVKISSLKTVEVIKMLAFKGTLTEDLKISWIKDLNQVCVWVAGFHIQNKKFCPSACTLYSKKYEEEIKNAFFLNDQYFIVETEEAGSRTFEILYIEPEADWFEKKEINLCKQLHKETFSVVNMNENIKIINIGNVMVFVSGTKNDVFVKVLNMKEGNKVVSEPKEFHLESSLYDVIMPKITGQKDTMKEGGFSLYLLDQELEVYMMSFSFDSGIVLKKIETTQPEEQKKELELNLFQDVESTSKARFPENIKNYHHGVFTMKDDQGHIQRVECLIIFKQKKFSLIKLDETTQVLSLKLPEYNNDDGDVEFQLCNWAAYEDFIYLVGNTAIYIYKVNFAEGSAILHKKEVIKQFKFRQNDSRWILVNPCLTVIVSARQAHIHHMDAIQVFIGSTQKLLIPESLNYSDWSFQEFLLGHLLNYLDTWQDVSELGQETFEWKFENERLLIKTHLRSYFRDFNVCEKRVDRGFYKWREQVKYDLREADVSVTKGDLKVEARKSSFDFPKINENKNHEKSKKHGYQNWKNVEKKEMTEEKEERKQIKKKGDKYYKNVRQDKHSKKMSD